MTIFGKILTGSAGLAMVAAAAPAAAQYGPYGGNSGGGVGAVINQILGGGRYGAYGQGQDRVAVDQCARAAEARVSGNARAPAYGNYPGYGDPRYANGAYPNQGYGNRMIQARVIGITGVERRSNGLKVSGVMDSGRNQYRGAYAGQAYPQPYPNQGYAYPNPGYAYPNQGYAGQGYPGQNYGNAYAYGQPAQVADLRFSCRVDYRGYVSDVDIRRNGAARRTY